MVINYYQDYGRGRGVVLVHCTGEQTIMDSAEVGWVAIFQLAH